MIRLLRLAQYTANIAPPIKQIPKLASASPDIQVDTHPPVAGSDLI